MPGKEDIGDNLLSVRESGTDLLTDERVSELITGETSIFKKNYDGFKRARKSGLFLIYKNALEDVVGTEPGLVIHHANGETVVNYSLPRSSFEGMIEADRIRSDPRIYNLQSDHRDFGPVLITTRVFALKPVGLALRKIEERIYRRASDSSHVWALWTGSVKFPTSEKIQKPPSSNALIVPRNLVPIAR